MATYVEGYVDGIVDAQAVILDLELRWRTSATKVREAGSAFEATARTTEAAADGLAAVRKILDGFKALETEKPPRVFPLV